MPEEWTEAPKHWSTESFIRYTNTTVISDYIKWNYIDDSKTQVLKESDMLYEEFMLWLRSYGVNDISKFRSVLEPDFQEKLDLYEQEGLVIQWDWNIKLSYEWLNVANRIIGELLK